jgi:hypothetical protein
MEEKESQTRTLESGLVFDEQREISLSFCVCQHATGSNPKQMAIHSLHKGPHIMQQSSSINISPV